MRTFEEEMNVITFRSNDMVDKFFARMLGPFMRLLYKYFFVWIGPSSPLGPTTGGVLTMSIIVLILSLPWIME